jgi:hypothetical protein
MKSKAIELLKICGLWRSRFGPLTTQPLNFSHSHYSTLWCRLQRIKITIVIKIMIINIPQPALTASASSCQAGDLPAIALATVDT